MHIHSHFERRANAKKYRKVFNSHPEIRWEGEEAKAIRVSERAQRPSVSLGLSRRRLPALDLKLHAARSFPPPPLPLGPSATYP